MKLCLPLLVVDVEYRNGVDEAVCDSGEQRSTAFGMVLMEM